MKKYIKYFIKIIRHKWFVFLEAREMGITWLGITHDLSKFLPDEFFPYANFNFKNKKLNTPEQVERFEMAWSKHQKRNKHHWTYWTFYSYSEHDKMKSTLIPTKYIKEMVVDWIGAGMAFNKPDPIGWYIRHKDHMILHPDTRAELERILMMFEPVRIISTPGLVRFSDSKK